LAHHPVGTTRIHITHAILWGNEGDGGAAVVKTRLELGLSVRCTDGVGGELADLVVDPVERRVTHVVVRRHRLSEVAPLAPVELVAAGGQPGEISLRCSVEELTRLEPVQGFAYLGLDDLPSSADDADWDVGVEDVLTMPYYEASEIGDYVGEF